ncbi:ROK family protein [Salinicoccus hispanicus]|nr:ROK family protein [Salinicoccus hispanicus]
MIIRNGPISKSIIAKKMNMSPTSSTRIVNYLLDSKLVVEDISNGPNKGKRNLLLPNKKRIVNICIEIDIDTVTIALINLKGEIISEARVFAATMDASKVVQVISHEVKLMTEKQLDGDEMVTGIGIAMPGIINPSTGTVKVSTQFNWKDVPLADMIREATDYDVKVDNELKLKALAENHYSIRKESSLVMVGFGNGVGSALITNDDIYRGSSNASGEIGHITLDPMGPRCTCGKYGCLQTYIAKDFLLSDARKSHDIESMEELIEKAQLNEQWAISILDKAVSYMILTLNNIVRIYNPSAIYVSGILIENHRYIHEKLENGYHEVDAFRNGDLKIELTQLKDEGALMGASLMIQRHYIEHLA